MRQRRQRYALDLDVNRAPGKLPQSHRSAPFSCSHFTFHVRETMLSSVLSKILPERLVTADKYNSRVAREDVNEVSRI